MAPADRTATVHPGRARAPARRRAKRRTWDQLKNLLSEAFREKLKTCEQGGVVDISHGYGNNIHVVVVSRLFDRMNDRRRQDWMWRIVDGTDLTDEEKQLISLIYPVSPSEIK
jgi:hypothetical protein